MSIIIEYIDNQDEKNTLKISKSTFIETKNNVFKSIEQYFH